MSIDTLLDNQLPKVSEAISLAETELGARPFEQTKALVEAIKATLKNYKEGTWLPDKSIQYDYFGQKNIGEYLKHLREQEMSVFDHPTQTSHIQDTRTGYIIGLVNAAMGANLPDELQTNPSFLQEVLLRKHTLQAMYAQANQSGYSAPVELKNTNRLPINTHTSVGDPVQLAESAGYRGQRGMAQQDAHTHGDVGFNRNPNDVPTVLKEMFIDANRVALSIEDSRGYDSAGEKITDGATALMSYESEAGIHIASAGDARALIMIRDTETGKITAKRINVVHDPAEHYEYQRIIHAGGTIPLIKGKFRVEGTLACARSLGDAEEDKYVVAEPDISFIPSKSLPLNNHNKETFLVLTCDGPFEKGQTEEFYAQALEAKLAQAGIIAGQKVPATFNVADTILKTAYETGSTDNLSVFAKRLDSSPKNDSYMGVFDGHSSEYSTPSAVAEGVAEKIAYDVKMLHNADKIRIANDLKEVIAGSDKIQIQYSPDTVLPLSDPRLDSVKESILVSFSTDDQTLYITFPNTISRKHIKALFGVNTEIKIAEDLTKTISMPTKETCEWIKKYKAFLQASKQQAAVQQTSGIASESAPTSTETPSVPETLANPESQTSYGKLGEIILAGEPNAQTAPAQKPPADRKDVYTAIPPIILPASLAPAGQSAGVPPVQGLKDVGEMGAANAEPNKRDIGTQPSVHASKPIIPTQGLSTGGVYKLPMAGPVSIPEFSPESFRILEDNSTLKPKMPGIPADEATYDSPAPGDFAKRYVRGRNSGSNNGPGGNL